MQRDMVIVLLLHKCKILATSAKENKTVKFRLQNMIQLFLVLKKTFETLKSRTGLSLFTDLSAFYSC